MPDGSSTADLWWAIHDLESAAFTAGQANEHPTSPRRLKARQVASEARLKVRRIMAQRYGPGPWAPDGAAPEPKGEKDA